MQLDKQQIQDLCIAIKYYMHHQISIKNPRYTDYEVILQMLTEYKHDSHD